MKFGYFVPYPRWDPAEPYEQVYRDAWEQVEYVDAAGFDYIWFPEHHFTNTFISPGPLLNVVDAARRTRRARLGTAVILAPFYNPLILAEQIALADHFTEGRLEIAFGRGVNRYEYERLQMTEAEAAARQRECIEILLKAWGQDEELSWNGTYYQFPSAYPVPRPYQRPHPRLGMAGRTAETLRFVVEHGLDLHTTPLRQPMSRVYANLNLLDAIVSDAGAPARPRVSCQQDVCVSEDPAEILAAMEYVRWHSVSGWLFHQNVARVDKGHAALDPLPEGMDVSAAELAERTLTGDPETCVRKLREYEALGFDEFIVCTDFGQPQQQVMRSLRRFAEQVMPHFRDSEGRPIERPAALGAGRNGARNGRRPASEVKRELLAQGERELGSGWRVWEAGDWLAHFDRLRAAGDDRCCYVFDFDCAPLVRGDAGGFVLEGHLMLVRDEACLDCGRPILALYRRWSPETMAEMKARVADEMRALNWHERHP